MQSGTTGINTVSIYNPIKQGHDQDLEGFQADLDAGIGVGAGPVVARAMALGGGRSAELPPADRRCRGGGSKPLIASLGSISDGQDAEEIGFVRKRLRAVRPTVHLAQ